MAGIIMHGKSRAGRRKGAVRDGIPDDVWVGNPDNSGFVANKYDRIAPRERYINLMY